MKIDLHVHTKKTISGDGIERNIDKKKFIEIMKTNNVGIVAITNHNSFDKEQYESFAENDKGIIVLPGVELDIAYGNFIRQANVIVPPTEVEQFSTLIDSIKNSKSNPLPFDDFINHFDKKKYILFLDYKSTDATKWLPDEMNRVQDSCKNAIVLADANKGSTLMVLSSHNFNALIGSDAKNWNTYEQESKNLLNTNLIIKDYETLIKILSYDISQLHESVFKNIHTKKINNFIMDGTNYSIKGLEIKTGVNVIFGAKRTGKTKILEKFYEDNKQRSVKYFSSVSPEGNLEQMKKSYLKNEMFIDEISDFSTKVTKLLNYNESKPFINYHLFHESLIRNSKIKFFNTWDKNPIDPRSTEPAKIQNLLDISNNTKLLNQAAQKEINPYYIKNNLKQIFENILKEAWIQYKKIHISYWNKRLNNNIYNKIKVIMKSNNGATTKPSTVGLVKRFEDKVSFANSLEGLKTTEKVHSKTIAEHTIPNRGKVEIKQVVNMIEFYGEKKSWEAISKLSLKTKYEKISKALDNLSYEDNFITIRDDIKEMIEGKDLYYKHIDIVDENGKTDFSNGEKAHLALFNILNTDAKYYLLDEPGVYLGSESISKSLLKKIADMKKSGKTIILTTHNASLGINTIPINYIFRKYKNGADECSSYQGTIWNKVFENISNKEDELQFSKEIINNFEGGKKHFSFRKEIYEN